VVLCRFVKRLCDDNVLKIYQQEISCLIRCVRFSEAEGAIPGSSKHEPLDSAKRDPVWIIR
jgi:hypothetical protein